MERATSRKTMLVYVAICFILHSKQTLGGDVFPIQAVEGLWADDNPKHVPFLDVMTNFTRQYDETADDQDIAWFKTNIIDKYGFIKDESLDMWKQQGRFGSALGTKDFKEAADRALEFFKRNPDWSVTKANRRFRNPSNGKCLNLLYITAARYLLVTHLLWDLSDQSQRLIPCQCSNKIVSIPSSTCYPEPYGSATCTSDYDVGLVGKDAGMLTERFNNYFESSLYGFGKSSEKVFDTNVYAFTLEYAVTKYFTGLPSSFPSTLAAAEGTLCFKMQELVNSYYKVSKYNENFAKQLQETARNSLGRNAVKHFEKWIRKVEGYNSKVRLYGDDVRQAHNAEYQSLVKSISLAGGYTQPGKNLEILGQALLYAAEAYHTRGAIRHVVGSVQLGIKDYEPSKLSLMDLWVSMIENWGETLKEYNHGCCDVEKNPVVKLEICVLKMSKYMWRMVAAMKNLKEHIEKHKKQAPKGASINPTPSSLVRFEGGNNPEHLMRIWYQEYKKKGEVQIPSTQLDVSSFFRGFGCVGVTVKSPLPFKCLETMNGRIDEYNRKIAEIFSKLHPVGSSDKESNDDLLKSVVKGILKRHFKVM